MRNVIISNVIISIVIVSLKVIYVASLSVHDYEKTLYFIEVVLTNFSQEHKTRPLLCLLLNFGAATICQMSIF